MKPFKLGIIGTGFIADIVAKAIGRSSAVSLGAVSSRDVKKAEDFLRKLEMKATAYGDWRKLLADPSIDGVYVATPTSSKGEIALAVTESKKHLLLDKPFSDTASLKKITQACSDKNLVFMDATHFVHHPRTAHLKAAAKEWAPILSVRTQFYFPFQSRDNIRFDPKVEPTGAYGDMAWYSMRAVVEYLQPTTPLSHASTVVERDPQTNAVVRASGLLRFEDGKNSTWDVGYMSGSVAMDLDITCAGGILSCDDFVLNWQNSFGYTNPDLKTGYSKRTSFVPRPKAPFVTVESDGTQETLMVDNFAALAIKPNSKPEREDWIRASIQTQALLDDAWAARVEK